MKVVIEMELHPNGCLSMSGVRDLLRRLAKITAHLLRSERVQPVTLKDEDGRTVADVKVEFQLWATPSTEALITWMHKQAEKDKWMTIPLPMWNLPRWRG